MEGVIRLQNAKNLKHSANLRRPGVRLIWDFLAKRSVQELFHWPDLFIGEPGNMGSQTLTAIVQHGRDSQIALCALRKVCDSRLLAGLSNLSTCPWTGQTHTPFSLGNQKGSENRKFFLAHSGVEPARN